MYCIIAKKKMRKLGYFVLQRIVKKSLRFMKGKMNALYYINQEVFNIIEASVFYLAHFRA